MAVLLGVVSQKGGVGKSTLSRLIAREYAAAGWEVKIADLDIKQSTSTKWKQRRDQEQLEPVVPVEGFGTVAQALKVAPQYDLVVFDPPPHSTAMTLEIARVSDGVVLTSGVSLEDLEPAVLLAHELVEKGVSAKKITFALVRVGESSAEIEDARDYIKQAGYNVLKGELPEKTLYRKALRVGRSVSEAPHLALRKKAQGMAQSLVDFVENADKQKR